MLVKSFHAPFIRCTRPTIHRLHVMSVPAFWPCVHHCRAHVIAMWLRHGSLFTTVKLIIRIVYACLWYHVHSTAKEMSSELYLTFLGTCGTDADFVESKNLSVMALTDIKDAVGNMVLSRAAMHGVMFLCVICLLMHFSCALITWHSISLPEDGYEEHSVVQSCLAQWK